MKLITLIIAIVLSLSISAQAKKDTAWKPATVKEEFISIEDVDTFLQDMAGKTLLTPQEFLKLRDAMTAIIAQAIERKRKEVKK